MSRLLADWISSYIEFCRNTESPLSYHTWSAISTIASTLQRRVFMRWGHDIIRANQYIVLIGPAGQTRKAGPIKMSARFLNEASVQISSNKLTLEALIHRMQDKPEQYIEEDTRAMRLHCSMACISDELSVFLGEANVPLLAALTDLYDSPDTWKYETKSKGEEKVAGVCINLFAGSAATWLPHILPREAIGGGFTSRVIFVVEQHKRQIIADPNLNPPDMELYKALVHDLQQIKQMTGEFFFDDQARALYVAWYNRQEKNIQNNVLPIADPRFASYISRRATHVKKVAIAVSASRGTTRVITSEDFERARKILEAAEAKMPGAFRGMGESRFAAATDAVMDFIMAKGSVRRSEVLRLYWRDVDAWTMQQIEQVLLQMRIIKVELMMGLDDRIYTYTAIKPEVED